MCDYSLMMVPNRLAIEGEELVAHRFQNGSTGMVSCFDFDRWATRRPKSFWQRLKEGFSPDREPTPVVCIPPGARLRLNEIQESLKARFPLGSCEDAVFTQISAEASQYRDAVCFANGATILVQWLPEGQRVRILRLCSQEDVEPALDRNRLARIA
jgi:hypothetical protein